MGEHNLPISTGVNTPLYGVPLEFDTAANESHHKPSKAAAKLTQRNLANFDIQVAIQLFEFMLIDLALPAGS